MKASGDLEYVENAHTAKRGRYRGHVDTKTYAQLLAMTARASGFESGP